MLQLRRIPAPHTWTDMALSFYMTYCDIDKGWLVCTDEAGGQFASCTQGMHAD